MDGNDSLKRVVRRETSDDDEVGPSSELPSNMKVHGDYYLSRAYVDKWVDGVVQEMMGDEIDMVSHCVEGVRTLKCRLTTLADRSRLYSVCR